MAKSKLPGFSLASLGDEEGTIREMIRRADPGDPMDYPCFMYILSLDNRAMKAFMNTPMRRKFRGLPAIELAFGGLGWFFILGREVVSEPLRKMVVNRRGDMRLMQREAASLGWLVEGVHRANVLLITHDPHPGPVGLPRPRSSRDRGHPCPRTVLVASLSRACRGLEARAPRKPMAHRVGVRMRIVRNQERSWLGGRVGIVRDQARTGRVRPAPPLVP